MLALCSRVPWGRKNGAMDRPKAYRALRGRKIAGVAMGLAVHLRVDVKYVRLAFILATIIGSGAGLIAYLAFWALLPMDPDEAATVDATLEPVADPGWLTLLGVVSLCGLLALVALGWTSVASWMVPLGIAVAGVALVWMRADEMQRARWRDEAAGVARDAADDAATLGRWRVLVGGAAVVIAILGMGMSSVGIKSMLQGLATSLLLVVGLTIVAFPWLHEQWKLLGARRVARIRADERAEMAARIHDSVLQTLTLVQKHADDPARIQQLARAEERELRDWLYGEERVASSFAAALQAAADDVEERHGVTMDVVVVGDTPTDSRIEALLAAAQEAMVNAAKHAGVTTTRVYAEVNAEAISVFVRDRGQGFDPALIGSDRAGLRDSISGRMERVGGTANIRTQPGDGTEIALALPRNDT